MLSQDDALRLSMIRRGGFGAYVSSGASAPTQVTRNISAVLAPGNDNGQFNVGTTALSSNLTYTNESGQTVTEIALVFCGWAHMLNAADTLSNANYDAAWTIEYPIGGGTQSGTTLTVTPGNTLTTDFLTLSTPIPAGAQYKVAVSTTPLGSGNVPMSRDSAASLFRPHGIVTRGMSNVLSKLCLGAIGDSIITNNGMPTTKGAAGICPIIQSSIIGSTGFQQIGNLTRRVALFQALGITHVVMNYPGANDHGASRTLAQLKADTATIASAFRAVGMKVIMSTITPKVASSPGTVSITSLTQTGGTATATVSDASRLANGQMVDISGAVETGYNTMAVISGLSGSTFNYLVPSATAATATGSPVVNLANMWTPHQSQSTGNYGDDTSIWAQFNDSIRNTLVDGAVDDYVECADALSIARNKCKWITWAEDTAGYFHNPRPTLTIATVVNSTRFTFTNDGYSEPNAYNSNFGAGSAAIEWLSGPNVGTRSNVGSTANGRSIILSAAPATAFAVGDTFAFRTGAINAVSCAPSDGLHPSLGSTTSGNPSNYGGVALLSAAYAAKFTALKASL